MNRDRDPTQVMDLPSPSSPTVADDPTVGLSKIKATALLLKQKVAGTSIKAQKVPNKISHPWAITSSSSRSASFSSPTSPSPSLSPYSNSSHGRFSQSSNPTLSSPSSSSGSASGAGGKGIKAMIAAREDPALSCNKMAPGGTQPVPAPQKRDVRAGMTKVQLSPQPQPQPQPQAQPQPQPQAPLHQQTLAQQAQQEEPSQSQQQHDEKQKGHDQEGAAQEERLTGMENEVELGKRSTRRRNGGGGALVASQFAASTSSTLSTPQFMKAFEDPRMVQAEVSLPTVPAIDTTRTAVNNTAQTEDRNKT
ncbi:hypothetical protein BGZ75_009480, partial [Mortierella antarctica]